MAGEGERIKRAMAAAAVEGVRRCGEDLLGKAQRDAPVEEGTLRASGELEVDVRPDEVTATVSFNEVYAARQHEETDWEHAKGGRAKYLEANLQAGAARYEHIIGLAVQRALR